MTLLNSLEIKWLLFRLPRSSDGIAKFLTKRGFKGYRSNSDSCPIAKYIHHYLHYPTIKVGGNSVRINDSYIKLPQAAKNFIHEFDHKNYPELIR